MGWRPTSSAKSTATSLAFTCKVAAGQAAAALAATAINLVRAAAIADAAANLSLAGLAPRRARRSTPGASDEARRAVRQGPRKDERQRLRARNPLFLNPPNLSHRR